ncbi:MAG: spermidine synthase [Aeromicrobium sp.]
MGSDEVVVRRRADGALELRVNGVFVMDDVETTSERRLAEVVFDRDARDVLVGGLGLGFTVRTLLAEGRVRRVVVAELHAEVVAAAGLTDPRLDVVIGDVRDLVAAQPDVSADAVLLDVDNGPDSLVHAGNAAVYGDAFVAECARILRPGGTLAVWSMADSVTLRATLGAHLVDVEAERVPVRLQGRDEAYWILTARR